MRLVKYVLIATILFFSFNFYTAFGQQPKLATFHETVQVLVDQIFQNQTSTSVSLISTSIQEMRIPLELEKKIQQTGNVTAVVITNQNQCVLGVMDQSCILVNISREGFSGGIKEAQSKGKEIGDLLINDINSAFKFDAKFHSIFIHFDDKLNKELNTTGVISGKGTVSTVYTMAKSDSAYLYEKLSTILLPERIRNDGGFFDAAKKIADDSTSSVVFSIIPNHSTTVFQLQVINNKPITNQHTVNPIELLGTEKLERSHYFDSGFFPLNSIVQVVVISNYTMKFTDHGSEIVPTIEKDHEKYPSDLTKNGWLFDPESGKKIVAKYLFGQTAVVNKQDLRLDFGNFTSENIKPNLIDLGNNYVYLIVGVAIAAGIAISLYLKKSRNIL